MSAFGESVSVAQKAPPCGFVAGALKIAGIHKGLCQPDRMPVKLLPIPGKPFDIQSKHLRGEIRNLNARQDQKTAVVGHKRQPLILEAGRPPNPPISNFTLQGRRRPSQQSHPLPLHGGHITERFPHKATKSKIMALPHEIVPNGPLISTNRPYFHRVQHGHTLFMTHAHSYTRFYRKSPAKCLFSAITNASG